MCKFKPFNKHVLVKKVEEVKETSPVLIPEEAKLSNTERYGLVEFLCAASDCEQFLKNLNPNQPSWTTSTGTMDDMFVSSAKNNGQVTLVVDNSMIEDVKVMGENFNIIHQNYIVGVVDE